MQMITYAQWRPEMPEAVSVARARHHLVLGALGAVGAAVGFAGDRTGLWPVTLVGGLILVGVVVGIFRSQSEYLHSYGWQHRVALVKELLADCGIDVDLRYGVPGASWDSEASRRARNARDSDMSQLAQLIDKAYRTQGAARYGTVVFQWQDSSLLASSTARI